MNSRFDEYYKEIFCELKEKLPRLSTGELDYTNAKKVPAIIICVYSEGELLLLKRSDKVHSYKNYWNAVGGYLDKNLTLKEQAKIELREETKITNAKITLGEPFTEKNKGIEWIIFPARADIKIKPEIVLDWEHTEYKWVEVKEVKKYKITPALLQVISRVNLS